MYSSKVLCTAVNLCTHLVLRRVRSGEIRGEGEREEEGAICRASPPRRGMSGPHDSRDPQERAPPRSALGKGTCEFGGRRHVRDDASFTTLLHTISLINDEIDEYI